MHQDVVESGDQSWPVSCGNCRSAFDEEDWEKLDPAGVHYSSTSDRPDVEMRKCAGCGMTLSIFAPQDFV